MAADIFSIYNLVEAVWVILPAYAANGLAPLSRGRRMMDFGRKFTDGRPVLGPGKTWEGLLVGCFFGALIGLVEMLAFPYLPWGMSDRPLAIAAMSPLLGLVLGMGAMLGDACGAFIKRRIGLERGRPAPVLDQLDFVVGSMLLASLMAPMRLEWFILLAVITPLCHIAANVIAYLLKVKKEPW